LTFRPLSEAFIRRKLALSSSGSWHDDQPLCQESGRTYGWVERGRNVKGFWFCFGRVIWIYLATLNFNQMNLFVEIW